MQYRGGSAPVVGSVWNAPDSIHLAWIVGSCSDGSYDFGSSVVLAGAIDMVTGIILIPFLPRPSQLASRWRRCAAVVPHACDSRPAVLLVLILGFCAICVGCDGEAAEPPLPDSAPVDPSEPVQPVPPDSRPDAAPPLEEASFV
ncbi:MAG: hypothetical protein V2J24_08500, partial [Pseudomonadales bacterium]|nr:hypothetical protein [Pseudomonadales bacterium]